MDDIERVFMVTSVYFLCKTREVGLNEEVFNRFSFLIQYPTFKEANTDLIFLADMSFCKFEEGPLEEDNDGIWSRV